MMNNKAGMCRQIWEFNLGTEQRLAGWDGVGHVDYYEKELAGKRDTIESWNLICAKYMMEIHWPYRPGLWCESLAVLVHFWWI